MKHLVLFIGIMWGISSYAEPAMRKVYNNAFQRGEKLSYKIHYGFLDAAEATLEVMPDSKKIHNRNTMHIVGLGRSKGTFDVFFKVRDRYETFLDDEAIVPWQFVRRVDEGGYKFSEDYFFHHHENKVTVAKNKKVSVVQYTQDMLSGFYYARTLNLGAASLGDLFTVPAIVDGEMFDLQIKFKGRETIKTSWGKIRCLKFVPVVQKGRIFKKEEDLVVWISDDANHIPIRAKADILFGSIKMDLIAYQNIMQPLRFEK